MKDNLESEMDILFLEHREERTIEGLSESPLQFMTQFFFMVFYIWLNQAEVSTFKIESKLLMCFDKWLLYVA